MIDTSAPTPLTIVPSTTMKDAMRVHCCAGRPMLVSHLLPTQGYTTWCPVHCKRAHLVSWQEFPSESLRSIVNAINAVLVERDGQVNGAGVE